MGIVETDMTLEDAEKALEPAPAAKYKVQITAFKTAEDGTTEVTFEKSGNKGMVANMKITGEGPTFEPGENFGKLVKPYNAIKGTSFMAMFKAAFPAANIGTGFNTDVAINMECLADLKISEYEGLKSNEVRRLYPLPA